MGPVGRPAFIFFFRAAFFRLISEYIYTFGSSASWAAKSPDGKYSRDLDTRPRVLISLLRWLTTTLYQHRRDQFYSVTQSYLYSAFLEPYIFELTPTTKYLHDGKSIFRRSFIIHVI